MSGQLNIDAVPEEIEEDEELDEIEWWFLNAGPTDSLVLHDADCPCTHADLPCECIPRTLKRGAQA